MANREFLQLSHTLSDKSQCGGWSASSKLDGYRLVWDGGVSRGILKSQVPYANNAKDERYLVAPVATGLWTRYGNVVHAPDWFLDLLPTGQVLDGEIWSPNLSRQQIRSICSHLVPDEDEWRKVGMHVFNRLSPATWLQAGRINNPNFSKTFEGTEYDWWLSNGGRPFASYPNGSVYEWLEKQTYWVDNHLVLVKQEKLPYNGWRERLDEMLVDEMAKLHGEGLILTNPDAIVEMKRSRYSIKVKPRDSNEGVVVGYISGREGKLRGMLGALLVKWVNSKGREIIFELSGFTDAERGLCTTGQGWAQEHLGEKLPESFECTHFPIGSRVGFSYRGETDDGVPNEGVYDRTNVAWHGEENVDTPN